jgi:hypothetical protein
MLIEDNSQNNLRSFVAPKQSIPERLEKYFQVHYLSRDQILLYDIESRGVPFFKTAHEMGKYLSYVILNILALFTTGQTFDLNQYNLIWKNRSVVVSSFLSASSDRIRIPIVKITLSGFQYTEIDVDKAIIAKAVSFTFAFLKDVKDLSKSGWSNVGKLPMEKFF